MFNDGEIDTTFSIALGGNPVGDKLYEGDQKTPEGIYKITWRRDGTPGNKSSFDLAFLINYPLPQDRIEFENAKTQGRIPPNVTNPGGHIEIHAGPDNYDWTLGCISIRKKGMQYLMDQKIGSGDYVGIVGEIPNDIDLTDFKN